MAGSTNITPIATLQASVNNNSTITVPSGVTPQHLGIAVFVSANLYSTGSVPAITGWVQRASNPSVANNMEWTVLTRLGGVNAGDTITITQNKTTQFDLYMIWYDSAGLDINQVGTPGGRSGTTSQYTVINGLTATASGQTAIVVATERTVTTGTQISSWSGTYTPGMDSFAESTTSVYSSNAFAHFLINSSTSTGNVTANYNMASGDGVGILFTLGTPQTASFLDPFTTANYSASDTPPGNWMTYYSDSAAPMGGGFLKMPFTTDYPWVYPYGQEFSFNMSTMTVEVWMEDVVNTAFSMRLTADGVPEKGWSFISVGINNGKLYMNQRAQTDADRAANGTGPGTDDVYTSNVSVQPNQPIVLRLRHVGGLTVYGDYSWDGVNWTNFASKTAMDTCMDPRTSLVLPMFQSGTSGASEATVFANLTQMNTGKFTPYHAAWRATTQWSYWDGTKEVEVPPGVSWDYEIPSFYIGPKVVGTATNAEIAIGTTITIPVPAGVQAGEYLVAAIAQTGTQNTNVPTPTGWAGNWGENAPAPYTDEIGMFYRQATSSEPASYTFTVNGGPASAQMVRVSKATGTDGGWSIYPLPVEGSSAQVVGSGSNVDSTSLDNELLISAVAIDSTSVDIIPPSATTLITKTTGTGLRLAMAFEQRPLAGNVPTRTWTTADGSSVSWVGMVGNFISGDSMKPGTLVYPSQQGAVGQIYAGGNGARVTPSTTTMPSNNIYPSPDNEPYPATNVYPDGAYPGVAYPGYQYPASTDYPGATNYPGALTYPDYSEIYPGG